MVHRVEEGNKNKKEELLVMNYLPDRDNRGILPLIMQLKESELHLLRRAASSTIVTMLLVMKTWWKRWTKY